MGECRYGSGLVGMEPSAADRLLPPSPSTPPRSKRRVQNPTNWMAGAVRILKKDNVPPEKDPYIDIDGGCAFAARLDSFENALLGITGRLNEVAAEQSRAAEKLNHTTCQPLEHNSVVLHDLSARVVAAENAVDAMTTSNIGPSVESMRGLGEIFSKYAGDNGCVRPEVTQYGVPDRSGRPSIDQPG